jgi:hypothetical protein
MENKPSVKAFKEGFLEVLHQHGYEKADIPMLMQKRGGFFSSIAAGAGDLLKILPTATGELIEGAARSVGPVLKGLTQDIPLAMLGVGSLGGGAIALVQAQEEARKIRLADEENRLNRLIATTEAENALRQQGGYF